MSKTFTPAAFTVSAQGKQVYFSQGNLQHMRSSRTWSFAENQYDMIGSANLMGHAKSYNATYGYFNSGSALADKIDLFGWSGSTGAAKWGIGTSTDNADYSGDFVDWGVNIGDGTIYRTLAYAEWSYLLNTRTNASERQGIARINLNANGTQYANGLILLPDSWTCPADVQFKSGIANAYSMNAYATYQTFTLAEWQKLEATGAIFLPASGNLNGLEVGPIQGCGYYWSATAYVSNLACYLYFYSNEASAYIYVDRYYGKSVRLVQDLK